MKMKLLIAGFFASSLLSASASASASEFVNCSSLDKDGFANAIGSCTLRIGKDSSDDSITVDHCVPCNDEELPDNYLMVDIEKATQAYQAYCEEKPNNPGCVNKTPKFSDPRYFPFVHAAHGDYHWTIQREDENKTCDIGDGDTALRCHIVH